MNATLKWILRETARLASRRLYLAFVGCSLLCLVFLAGCVSLDPALKATLRETDKHTIGPAIECYKAHGGPDATPLNPDDAADVDYEYRGFRKAIDADEVTP